MNGMMYTTNTLTGKECAEILRQVDIQVAIDYFGVTELLDAIGIAQIVGYLDDFQNDGECPGDDPRQTAVLNREFRAMGRIREKAQCK